MNATYVISIAEETPILAKVKKQTTKKPIFMFIDVNRRIRAHDWRQLFPRSHTQEFILHSEIELIFASSRSEPSRAKLMKIYF